MKAGQHTRLSQRIAYQSGKTSPATGAGSVSCSRVAADSVKAVAVIGEQIGHHLDVVVAGMVQTLQAEPGCPVNTKGGLSRFPPALYQLNKPVKTMPKG